MSHRFQVLERKELTTIGIAFHAVSNSTHLTLVVGWAERHSGRCIHTQVDHTNAGFAHIWSIVEVLFDTAWYYGVRHSFPPPKGGYLYTYT